MVADFILFYFKAKILYFSHFYVEQVFRETKIMKKKIAHENMKQLPSKVAYFSLMKKNLLLA